MKKKIIPGVNIQWPWSELLLNGAKTIETRHYPLPFKYEGVELAVIETPGKLGKKQAGINKARITGIIVFESSFKYQNKKEWEQDFCNHLVRSDDPLYKFNPMKEKWGWKVKKIIKFKKPKVPPTKRGIIFASECEI